MKRSLKLQSSAKRQQDAAAMAVEHLRTAQAIVVGAGLSFLSYLIDMAHIEAETISKNNAPQTKAVSA